MTCEKIAHNANDRISKLNNSLEFGLLNDLDAKIESKLAH
jgi:hypothetical protein